MFNFLKSHRGKTAASAPKLPRSVIAHFRAAESSPSIPEWWKADNLPARALARRFAIAFGDLPFASAHVRGCVRVEDAREIGMRRRKWRGTPRHFRREVAQTAKRASARAANAAKWPQGTARLRLEIH